AVIISDLRFKLYATGFSDFPKQIIRCIARFDSAFVNDDYPSACHLDFGQDVSGKQNGVLPAKILNQLAHLPDLIRVETNGGLVENEKVRFREKSVRQTDALAIAFR